MVKLVCVGVWGCVGGVVGVGRGCKEGSASRCSWWVGLAYRTPNPGTTFCQLCLEYVQMGPGYGSHPSLILRKTGDPHLHQVTPSPRILQAVQSWLLQAVSPHHYHFHRGTWGGLHQPREEPYLALGVGTVVTAPPLARASL